LSFDGEKLSETHGPNRSSSRQANMQWLSALAATFLFPGEDKAWHGQAPFLAERGGFLSLLLQDGVNR
jgi:hypothetical protein